MEWGGVGWEFWTWGQLLIGKQVAITQISPEVMDALILSNITRESCDLAQMPVELICSEHCTLKYQYASEPA